MTVAVVGAGYAGMAAAVELAAAGRRVHVFEASRTLGGRARAVDLEGLRLDNGAHILLGAYGETLRLMQLAGAAATALRRLPLRLEYPGEFAMAAPRLPAPWHLAWALLAARGLPLGDKLAALRFMRGLAARSFRLPADTTAAALLASQPGRVRRYLWDPLCLAALNTPPERASAQVFANVLRDSLAAQRAASDLLLPAVDFSSLFPEPAARYVVARGGRVHRTCRIAGVRQTAEGFALDGHGVYRQLVVAVAPQHLASLLRELPAMAATTAAVATFDYEPIVTGYLGYAESVRLPCPMVGMADGCPQWLFDRGQLAGQHGIVAGVISARGDHEALDHRELAARLHAQVARIVPGLPAPRWSRVIAERRATFACTPNLPRPATATPLPGLFLAGDYVAGDYPATLEGAVRSGVAAARSVLGEMAAV